ncbi:MAG TPA: universal stress protein, partial [Pyrinomonadaceae bacterium]|nr:universal stress protein [Pyrinomonadaceae bacterium]
LVAKADEWSPDLIVVGSHGRTALGRFVLGSVSQRVLTEAKCSVRIARGRVEEPNSPVRIIVGTDGSQASEEALRAVAARHWPPLSEIKVVLVDDPAAPEFLGKLIPPLREIVAEDRQEARAWVEEISDRSAQILRAAGVKVKTVVREGDPKRELPKAAEEWGANCIFVGSAGFSNRLERFVLGSISAAVAARAHCTVEVVRKGSSNPE